MKQIQVKLKLSGEVEIDAQGFTDSSCKKATDALEQAMGGKAVVADKPEAFIPAVNPQQESIQYGTGY
jgi:hypothetical protein